MIEITSEQKPIKMWLAEIEDGALRQAKNLANLPFIHRHVAIMPDAHEGFGMPIGGVIAALDAIIPNAVGVDIGCGMCAVRTDLKEDTFSDKHKDVLKALLGTIRRRIPVGFKHHKTRQIWESFDHAPDIPIINQELNSASFQLGTLGGGNHFIEIQRGDDGSIWIMLHSGSRNFGYKIAGEYHKKARTICEKRNLHLPDKELAFLPADSKEGEEYFAAMNFALEFAQANRDHMMEVIKEIFKDTFPHIRFDMTVNIHHNYAAKETHFKRDVIVHRKGATSARANQPGIIPGSQGTRSYIVKGRGNPESFMSCSHGAGRVLGRKEAMRRLDLQKEKNRLDEKGILHSIHTVKDLDEAAGAYKDIEEVMKQQKDLVEIVVALEPLAVIKG
ncbi:MAG: RtcB family protein [Spirochaetota bacterium]